MKHTPMNQSSLSSSRPSNYSLNQTQIYILKLTHKFRFITGPLLAHHRNKSLSSTNIGLTKLHKQGYLGRHYDKSYKLLNKPASYYLTNKAIRYLKANTELSDKALHQCYKDKHMNSRFIEQCLLIYRVFLNLRKQYPDHIFYTANDMRNDDHYPDPLPQLYFHDQDGSNEYMLDIFTENLFFYIKKRIDQYVKHYDEEGWINDQYPTVMLIAPDSRLKEKAIKYFEEARDNIFADSVDLSCKILSKSIEQF